MMNNTMTMMMRIVFQSPVLRTKTNEPNQTRLVLAGSRSSSTTCSSHYLAGLKAA